MRSRSRRRPPRIGSASPPLSRSVVARAPLDEVRRWIAGRRLGAAYITRPVSIGYLTGFHAEPHERLMALVVRQNDATLIVPALERQKAVERASHAGVVAWRDGDDPYDLVRLELDGMTEVGVEKDHLSLHAADGRGRQARRPAARDPRRRPEGSRRRHRCGVGGGHDR